MCGSPAIAWQAIIPLKSKLYYDKIPIHSLQDYFGADFLSDDPLSDGTEDE
jgi:hypothetical protein